ncbi:MAG: pirin family protein [Bacteroidota bacterium]
MKTIVHQASSRGGANHGWLKAQHSFSFARFYNPDRMGFGLLRVLNDDIIAPSMGFGAHPHDNMEIITIPLSGALRHQDSTGNQAVIETNDVQIMSAGTGLTHSEVNNSTKEEVKLLQIWILPKEENIAPRYEQKTFSLDNSRNAFVTVVSPEEKDQGVWINQDAYLSLASLDQHVSLSYQPRKAGNGAYIFVIEGEVEVADTHLGKRDAMGLVEFDNFDLTALTPNTKVLVIDLPMN